MIVVAIIGILAAIAVPNFQTMVAKSKRAELPTNVQGVYLSELAYDAATDEYISGSANPASTPGKSLRAHDPAMPGWDSLGWHPNGELRGSYEVVTTATEFTVTASSDIDADGIFCQYSASESQTAVLRAGDENVY